MWKTLWKTPPTYPQPRSYNHPTEVRKEAKTNNPTPHVHKVPNIVGADTIRPPNCQLSIKKEALPSPFFTYKI